MLCPAYTFLENEGESLRVIAKMGYFDGLGDQIY